MLHRNQRFLILFVVFLLPMVACSLPSLGRSGDSVPNRDIQISEAAAESLETKMEDASNFKDGTRFALVVTEEEITSLVNLRLDEAAQDVPLEDLRIWFDPGKMIIRGRVQAEGVPISGTAVIIAVPQVTDGKLTVEIEKATIGIVPLPDVVLNPVQDQISRLLQDVQQHSVSVEKVQISTGVMEIVVTR